MATECERFGRYLIGARPTPYVLAWYEAGHADAGRFAPRGRADRVLLAMSAWSWFPLRAVDMAARFVAPGGALRRKLVFLTALFENAPESWESYEAPDAKSRAGFFIGLAGRGALSALALLLGLAATAAAWTLGVGR